MASGCVIKRCKVCRREGKTGLESCNHREARYVVIYRVGNKQKWETIGSVKKDAEKRLAQIIYEVNNGTYYKPTDTLFKEFTEKWLEKYASVSVKSTTLRTYRQSIKTHLLPFFGNKLLRNITTEDIQGFVAETSKRRKPKTVNNLLILLKTILKHAKNWNYIKYNPASDIKNVKSEHKEMDFLKPNELRLLLNQAREPYKTMFLTAALTGMRRGELLALQWGDVDWNSNTIFIRRSIYWAADKDRSWQFTSPKSKRSIRAIVMSPKLKEALQIHRLSSMVNQYDLIFCNGKGNPIEPNNMVKRHFLPALSFAGLRRVSFHSLRHSYTSLLIAQGENIKFIQSQLGHASIQTTLDRYGHLLPVNQVGVGERVDQQLFGVSANTRLTEYPQTRRNTINQEKEERLINIGNI